MREVLAGDELDFSGVRVRVSHAEHDERRAGSKVRAAPVGYALLGSCRAFFAGDTDVFPGLEHIVSDLDLALIPIWGWGASLGTGHLDPTRAAEAVALLRPRVAVPIHWGTFRPLHRGSRAPLSARSGGRVRGRRARAGARGRDPRAGSRANPSQCSHESSAVGGFGTKRLVRSLQTGRVLPALFVTMVGLIFAFAAIMRIVDSESFPTYGTALWWSVSTVTTVGYGDVVPKQPFGRLVAGVLMVLGFAFLSLVTGTIASALVSRYKMDTESDPLVDAIDRLERTDRRAREARRLGAHGLGVRVRQTTYLDQLEPERLHAVEHSVQRGLVDDLPVEHRLDRLHVGL